MRRMLTRGDGARYGATRRASVRTSWPSAGAATVDGISALARSAVLYGQTIAPSLFYTAAGYNGTTWVGEYGPTLVLAGTGAAPTLVDGPTEAVAPEDAAVRCNYSTGKHFSSTPDVASGDVSTEDIVVEVWIKPGANALEFVFSKRGSTTQGWFVYSSSTSVTLSLRQASTTAALGVSGLTAGAWSHVAFAVDRSSVTGMYACVNGVLRVSYVDPTALTTITSSVPVFIGAANSSDSYCSGDVALAAMYKAPAGWLDAGDKGAFAAWALARYNAAMGA